VYKIINRSQPPEDAPADLERSTMMKRLLWTALTALWVFATVSAPVQARETKAARHRRMAKYHAEHSARMHRHRRLTPAQRHARMKRYAAEHRARQHRHRAHMKASRSSH
jgi:hypothetical protein